MKALVHCSLLALLFVPAVIMANNVSISSDSPTTVSSVTTQSNNGSVTTASSVTTQSNNGSVTTASSVTTQSNNGSATTASSVTTQSNNESSSITVTEGDSQRTVSSVTFSSVISPNTSNPNPDNTDGCKEDSCSGGASCVSLKNTHFCLCIDGYYYNSSKCNRGKIFPGTISVEVSEISGLQDGHSAAYEKLHLEVTKFIIQRERVLTYARASPGPVVIPPVHDGPSGHDFSSYPGPAFLFASFDDCQYIKESNINVFLFPGRPLFVSCGFTNNWPLWPLDFPNLLWFKDAFVSTDYGQTVINKVRISPSARSEFRANQDAVITVVNLFPETTKESKTSVSSAIDKAIKNSSNITKYTAEDLCDFYGCVKTNADDDCSDGLLCKCKEGSERPNPQIALCVGITEATSCPDNCNAEHHKQCLMKNGKIPECLCLPGYKQKDGGICQACAFGYGGVNCEDYFQLILIIVGIVAGVLILGMVIALILVRSNKKKNNVEEENLIKNDFQNLRLQETPGFSNLGADGSIFPKIRTNYSRENQLQNPYVNQRGIPRPDY